MQEIEELPRKKNTLAHCSRHSNDCRCLRLHHYWSYRSHFLCRVWYRSVSNPRRYCSSRLCLRFNKRNNVVEKELFRHNNNRYMYYHCCGTCERCDVRRTYRIQLWNCSSFYTDGFAVRFTSSHSFHLKHHLCYAFKERVFALARAIRGIRP